MEYRKVQGIGMMGAAGTDNTNNYSVSIVLPKDMCKKLDIGKGDYVKVSYNGDKRQIIIEKAVAKVLASAAAAAPEP